MYGFSETQVNIILPLLIIILSLIFKFAINNNFCRVGIGEEMVKFPSDISLLSLSFVSTFIITSTNNVDNTNALSGIVYLFLIFIISLITYGLTKKTTDLYLIDNKSTKQIWQLIGLFFISYLLSIPILIGSIILLVVGVE